MGESFPPNFDPYAVLGVPTDVTPDQLRAAYLARVKEWHPDHYPSYVQKVTATKKMQDINVAYDLLSDLVRRARFDQSRLSRMPSQHGVMNLSVGASRSHWRIGLFIAGFVCCFLYALYWGIEHIFPEVLQGHWPSRDIGGWVSSIVLLGFVTAFGGIVVASMGLLVAMYTLGPLYLVYEEVMKSCRYAESRPSRVVHDLLGRLGFIAGLASLYAVLWWLAELRIPGLSLLAGVVMYFGFFLWIIVPFFLIELFAIPLYLLYGRMILRRTAQNVAALQIAAL